MGSFERCDERGETAVRLLGPTGRRDRARLETEEERRGAETHARGGGELREAQINPKEGNGGGA